jgi:Fe-Mn family superoxide dismutase
MESNRKYLLFISIFIVVVLIGFVIYCLIQGENFETNNKTEEKIYSPKDFNYIIPKIKGIHPNLMKMHFKLYEGLTHATNKTLQEIKKSDKNSLIYGALKKRLSFFYNGMKLHELFFEGMDSSKNKMPENIKSEIINSFGSVNNWTKDFKKSGEIVDIGFVALVKDKKNGKLMNIFITEFEVGDFIEVDYLLVMDVWEHAYITQFGLDINKYIDVFLQNINWEIVSERLKN